MAEKLIRKIPIDVGIVTPPQIKDGETLKVTENCWCVYEESEVNDDTGDN